MRLAHHLLLGPTGIWSFRLVVPRALREVVGKGIIKHSLRTRDVAVARAYAYAYGARYAAAFAAFRSACMAKLPSVEEILRAAQSGGLSKYELSLPSGVRLRADGPDDHSRAMEALRLVLDVTGGPSLPRGTAAAPTAAKAAASRTTLGEVVKKYLLTLETAHTPAKSRTVRRAAAEGFAKWKGEKVAMHEVVRTDVAEWMQSLRASGLLTPTLVNKASYLKSFFAWAQSAGYYPPGDNPAAGQVKFTTSEKRQRRPLGFRPFTPEQVQAIFAPEALATLNEQTRWGALIGLYTGARVSEVGQLRLDDVFCDDDDVWCFRITDQGAGQSLKNASSARELPVHPKLIELGLLERVEQLRGAGKAQLFPLAKAGNVNGMGNWLSTAFSRHLRALQIQSSTGKGKVGFHSLRKTFIQTAQRLGVTSEARAQLVGHELGDEHHAKYSATFTCKELLEGVGEGARKTEGLSRLAFPSA